MRNVFLYCRFETDKKCILGLITPSMCRRTSSNTRKFPKNTIDDKIVTPVTRSKNHKNHDFLTFFAYFRLNLKEKFTQNRFIKSRPPSKIF